MNSFINLKIQLIKLKYLELNIKYYINYEIFLSNFSEECNYKP